MASQDWTIIEVSIRGAYAGARERNIIELAWLAKDAQHTLLRGTVTLSANKDTGHPCQINAETLPKEFVQRVLAYLVDDAVFVG